MRIVMLVAVITGSLFSAALPASASPNDDGWSAIERGDYPRALELLRPLAEQGDPVAQVMVGVLYQRGLGVTQNYDEARKLFLLSAEKGNLQASVEIGLMYAFGLGVTRDYKEAKKWWRPAAEKGYGAAQINLGNMYQHGTGVTQDMTRAYMWYDLAASQPNSRTGGLPSKQLAAKRREEIRSKMTVSQIAQSRAAVEVCFKSSFRNCGLDAAERPTSTGGIPISIQMKTQGGTYVVPVLINNAITLDFVIDSGAADVSIPADVVSTLIRTETLNKTDFIGKQTYRLADGSTMPSTTFRIRSLKVGDKVLQDITGSIAPAEGSLLLGQSFLGRFKSWSIDNTTNALLLNE